MRTILSALVTLLTLNVAAQIRYVNLPLKKSATNTYCYAGDQQLVYFIREGKTLHLAVLDSGYTPLTQTKYNLEEFITKSEGVVGVTELNHRPAIVFGDKKLENFSTVSYNAATGNLIQFSYPKLAKDEYYLNSFSDNGRFYLLCYKYNEDNPALILNELAVESGTYIPHEIPLRPMGINLGNAHGSLYGLLFTSDEYADISALKKVRYDEPNTNVNCNSECKLYVANNQVQITMNHVPDTTQVITIDLLSYTAGFRKIAAGTTICNTDKKAIGNSFLHNNHLFYLAACHDNLVFKIQDFSTGKTLAEWVTTKDDTLVYKNGPVYKRVNQIETQAKITTRQLLNKLTETNSSMQPGIGVTLNTAGEYEVYIGTCQNTSFNSPFVMPYMFMPTFTAPTLNNPAGFGMYSLLPTLLWNEGFTNKMTDHYNLYFKTCVNASTLAYVNKGNELAVYDKLSEVINKLKENESLTDITAVKFNNTIVVSYLLKEEKLFVVQRFNPGR